MYTIVCNEFMKEWLDSNLLKYEVQSTTSTIDKHYKHLDFDIILYKSNALVIKGNISKRIYKKLISISQENNYIGCDEVGVGDFFGPVVYTAVYLDNNSLEQLSNSYINIKDSKKCTDEEVFSIYENIKGKINYKVKKVYDYEVDGLNSIAQKSFYHHYNIEQYNDEVVQKVVIDLFTTEKAFYNYKEQLKLEYNHELILETKADSKYICVALASIISRAIFLEEISKIEKKYNMDIPLGSVHVKSAIEKFLNKYSKEELSYICKTTFKTYKDL